MKPRRQVDLHGSISACNAAGQRLRIDCVGPALKVDADSVRAALSAYSALRGSGAANALGPLALDRLDDFQIELSVNGRIVGRAGAGVRGRWWTRALTRMPVELSLPALLRAVVTAF